jgi:hypothetical protein
MVVARNTVPHVAWHDTSLAQGGTSARSRRPFFPFPPFFDLLPYFESEESDPSFALLSPHPFEAPVLLLLPPFILLPEPVLQATGLELKSTDGCLIVGLRVGRLVLCTGCFEGFCVGLKEGFAVVGASVGEIDTVGLAVSVGAGVGIPVGRNEGGAVASLFLVCTDGTGVGSVLKSVGDEVGGSVVVADETGDGVGRSVVGLELGRRDGCLEGRSVGRLVGTKDGSDDGAELGAADGCLDGDELGGLEGSLEGGDEGEKLGDKLGVLLDDATRRFDIAEE